MFDVTKRTFKAFQYRGKVRWVTEVELQRLMTAGNLRSPEILEYFILSKDMNKKDELKFTGTEMVFNAPLVEVNEQVMKIGFKNTNWNYLGFEDITAS